MVTLSMISLFMYENQDMFPDRIQILQDAIKMAGKDGMLVGEEVVELLGRSTADSLFGLI